ncbi:MAG TPA: inositol monophosphatase [Bacteroidetes bacterium]|nr:inositol monophosphatase [Bacteroidota bacterium]
MAGLLDHSVQAAKIAGDILMDNFGKLRPDEIKNKTAFDFVTETDTASERAIIQFLREHYPDHAVYAEESGESDNQSDFQWLIDPLDGTKNYIHSFPLFSVSIGLRYKNKILTGVVYAPLLHEMFTAITGQGAFLNDRPIRVSQTKKMTGCFLATGFPHGAKNYLDVYLQTFRELFLQVSAVRRAGSAALDLAYTACGRFDGFWEFKLNPWDIGAGLLLIQEAGGIITDPLGGTDFFDSGNLVAGNSVVHKKMIEIIAPICREHRN